MKKTSTFQNGLIWFGAGVSLAEILTGTAFAPLGMAKGFAAILLGHIIGCAMMLLAGLIGGRTGRSAMETVKMSFGQKGGLLFAFLNVLQLVGWTAIMIYDGALAVGGIFAIGRWVWCLVIGALIIVWIAVGVTDLGWINKITMAALFILTLVLCKVIFFSGNAMVGIDGESLTFGAAVELAVAMPLSWLPLISDYTRDAEKPTQATWVSVLVYGAVSCWMYVIGMGAAIFTGEYDIAVIMVKAGLGIAALVILVFSTVTTTFLDAWSAGISAESLSAKLDGGMLELMTMRRYTPRDSTLSGLMLTPSMTDDAQMPMDAHYSFGSTSGVFMKWDALLGAYVSVGATAESDGETVVWSAQTPAENAKDPVLTITVTNGREPLGEAALTLTVDGEGYRVDDYALK